MQSLFKIRNNINYKENLETGKLKPKLELFGKLSIKFSKLLLGDKSVNIGEQLFIPFVQQNHLSILKLDLLNNEIKMGKIENDQKYPPKRFQFAICKFFFKINKKKKKNKCSKNLKGAVENDIYIFGGI